MPQLLDSERGTWTDATGEITKSSPSEDLPDDHWRWVDTQWHIDKTWRQADDQGWIYSYVFNSSRRFANSSFAGITNGRMRVMHLIYYH